MKYDYLQTSKIYGQGKSKAANQKAMRTALAAGGLPVDERFWLVRRMDGNRELYREDMVTAVFWERSDGDGEFFGCVLGCVEDADQIAPKSALYQLIESAIQTHGEWEQTLALVESAEPDFPSILSVESKDDD